MERFFFDSHGEFLYLHRVRPLRTRSLKNKLLIKKGGGIKP